MENQTIHDIGMLILFAVFIIYYPWISIKALYYYKYRESKKEKPKEPEKEIILQKIVGDYLLSFSPNKKWIKMEDFTGGKSFRVLFFSWYNADITHLQAYNFSILFNSIQSDKDMIREYKKFNDLINHNAEKDKKSFIEMHQLYNKSNQQQP